jgi:hypothetical protein
MQIIYCDPTEAEKDFYEALFKRSKVFFFSLKILIVIYIYIFHITVSALKMATLIKLAGELYAGKV